MRGAVPVLWVSMATDASTISTSAPQTTEVARTPVATPLDRTSANVRQVSNWPKTENIVKILTNVEMRTVVVSPLVRIPTVGSSANVRKTSASTPTTRPAFRSEDVLMRTVDVNTSVSVDWMVTSTVAAIQDINWPAMEKIVKM